MAPKRPKVPKVKTQGVESPSRQQGPNIEDRTEALVRKNGQLVEGLFESEVWRVIVEPLINESIASVCGRKSGGRWHHGSITRNWTDDKLGFYSGYQKGLMDLENRLIDFIRAKDQLGLKRKEEEQQLKQPFINPFLDDDDEYSSN